MTPYAAGTTTPTSASPTIKFAPSNYFRSPAGPSSTVGEGMEFVVRADQVRSALGRNPVRTDRIYDSELGILVITEARPMFDLGGALIGYRIRTE